MQALAVDQYFPPLNLLPAKSMTKRRRFTGLLYGKKSIGQVQANVREGRPEVGAWTVGPNSR